MNGQRLRRFRRTLINAILIWVATGGLWLFNPAHAEGIQNFSGLWGGGSPLWASNLVLLVGGASTSSAPYDLYATDTNERGTIPFDVNWPVAPDTSTEATVTNQSELFASLAVSNRKTIIPTGTTITVTSGTGTLGDDHHLEIQPGAELAGSAGTLWLSAEGWQRFRIDGGGTLSCGFFIANAEGIRDFHVDNLDLSFTSTHIGFQYFSASDSAGRIAITNCTGTDMQGIFTIFAGGLTGIPTTDVIIAGCDFQVHEYAPDITWGFRIENIDRLIMVDVHVASHDNGYHMIRNDYGGDGVWWRNIQVDDGGAANSPSNSTQGAFIDSAFSSSAQSAALTKTNVYLYDIAIYGNEVGTVCIDGVNDAASDVQNLTVENYHIYNDNASGVCHDPTGQTNWDITDSTYEAYTTPPAWSL